MKFDSPQFKTMVRSVICPLGLAFIARFAAAAEIQVGQNGGSPADGSPQRPFRTISAAAHIAQPGDTITVHAGVYRERVNPARGGESESKRIIYRAAPGEKVTITGAEIVTGWVKVQNDTWKASVPNSWFGSFNPYRETIHGDWFDPKGRLHHPGCVYLNGEWLLEAAQLDEVLAASGSKPTWFAQVDPTETTLWAQFPGVDPNRQRVEINVRQTVFYPDQVGRNFITVRGFILCQAATPWAPPTAEQVGLIGPHWSKGWIIEDNIISHSTCCGISLGKYGDEFDNQSGNSAEGYVATIKRALAHGWNKATVGHHVVRNNTISHCEQAGIVGSLGCSFSSITGNTIHDIYVRRLFGGAEMAGIKFHGAVDVVIADNQIYRTWRAMWMDWMAQGARLSRNLTHDNDEDLMVEVDHGPFLVDNNSFLSPTSLIDWSDGGAYVGNLMTGLVVNRPELERQTPYLVAHGTALAGLSIIRGGDDRFYNNIFIGRGPSSLESSRNPQTAPSAAVRKSSGGNSPFVSLTGGDAKGYGLSAYDSRPDSLQTGGNVYLNGARPYVHEAHPFVEPGPIPPVRIILGGRKASVELQWDAHRKAVKPEVVSLELLGRAKVSGLPYEFPPESALPDLAINGKQAGPANLQARP